jgi:SAM-dependent methyltransferase
MERDETRQAVGAGQARAEAGVLVRRLPALPSTVGAARDPRWLSGPLVPRACPVCGQADPQPFVVRPDGVTVHRCGACGHLHLAEVPSDDALAAFYHQYAATQKGYARRRGLWQRIRLELDALRDFNVRVLEQTGGLFGQRVLEFGASYGTLLARLRNRGARCSAVEVDAGAREALVADGFEVFGEPPREGGYDVVAAMQVLEHLVDPRSLLLEAARLLRPDGRLLLAVPNGGEVVEAGPSWVGFRVDFEHLSYFSRGELARLCLDAGLIVEQAWETDQPGIFRRDALPTPRDLRTWGRLFGPARAVRAGRYVLTLVARKVA